MDSTVNPAVTAQLTPEPVVTLENAFSQPYNNAVATARTCYSSKVIHPGDVDKDEQTRARRDAIAEGIYQAGHHTTIQHATFQFVLEKVSRQFIWSFLHAHPYYNSEQVSQRYVEVKPENFVMPPLSDRAREVYLSTIHLQMEAYHRLMELLRPAMRREYTKLFAGRDQNLPKWQSSIKKKIQEVARYVLPVATQAHLYHTVSGITLHRYHRLCRQFDTPLESRIVIGKMVEAVGQWDPDFFKNIEDEIPLEQTLEYQVFQNLNGAGERLGSKEFIAEFDAGLEGKISKLVDYKINGERSMAQAVRTVLGLRRSEMSDEEAIDQVMNPAKNPYFGEALNLTTMSKLTRAMFHPHFTFRKKISHTADSQDQRHRTTPASRPVLFRQFVPGQPDYIIPALIQASPEAKEYFENVLRQVWEAIAQLLEMGVSQEFALYLLPNAFPIRFEESGDLLGLHHKWTKRLCYTAQEEIWRTCLEEVMQVQQVAPLLARHVLPPCGMRLGAGIRPICPEGDRFCGLPVWKYPLEKFSRIL